MMSTAGIRRLVVGNIVSHKNQVKTDSKLRGLRAATPQTFGKLLSDYHISVLMFDDIPVSDGPLVTSNSVTFCFCVHVHTMIM